MLALRLAFSLSFPLALQMARVRLQTLRRLVLQILVQNFTYTDLQNINRIQTTGAHIALLNTAKQGLDLAVIMLLISPWNWRY
jgi:hypothetical protein